MTLRYAIAVALLCAACEQDEPAKYQPPDLAFRTPLPVWMGPHDNNSPPQCETWHCQCATLHC